MCFLTLKITSFSAKIYNLKPKNPKNLYTPSKHLILPNFYLFTFANHITGKGRVKPKCRCMNFWKSVKFAV